MIEKPKQKPSCHVLASGRFCHPSLQFRRKQGPDGVLAVSDQSVALVPSCFWNSLSNRSAGSLS